MSRHAVDPITRLLSRVEINPDTGCWEWQGSDNGHGYGHMGVSSRTVLTHRYAYEQLVGPIPSGLTIDHLCRVRRCCNPEHLEPVTMRVNILRGTTGAHNARKTHCPHGHEYTPANTYVSRRNQRRCRACKLSGWIKSAERRNLAEVVA